jgi:hypothetical protein
MTVLSALMGMAAPKLVRARARRDLGNGARMPLDAAAQWAARGPPGARAATAACCVMAARLA